MFQPTPKQIEILKLIYKFRFLNRTQLQSILNHKQKQKIIIWLNQLTEQKYLKRYFDKKLATIPAAYSLGSMARKYFLKNPELYKDITAPLLSRVWRESSSTQKFKRHCMLVADIYISLIKLIYQADGGKGKLNFFAKTDLGGVQYLILPEPDAYFSLGDKDGLVKRYLLDIFDDLPPRMIMRKRIKQYFNYFEKAYWQDHMKHDFPEIIIVCPDNTSKNYLNVFIKRMLKEKTEELSFYLALRDEIQQKGLNKGVLEKVVPTD